jgi:hypothetical protein
MRLGTSIEAVSQDEGALTRFDTALRYCTSQGFTLCRDKSETAINGLVIGPGVSRINLIRKLASKYPRLGKWGRMIQLKLAKKNIHI